MRTTIDIPDELHRDIKVRAAQEGRTVKDLVLEILNSELRREDRASRVKLPMIKAKRKAVFNLSREEIDEAMFG